MEGNEEWRSFCRPAVNDLEFSPGIWERDNIPDKEGGEEDDDEKPRKVSEKHLKSFWGGVKTEERKVKIIAILKERKFVTCPQVRQMLGAGPKENWVSGILNALCYHGYARKHGRSNYEWIGDDKN